MKFNRLAAAIAAMAAGSAFAAPTFVIPGGQSLDPFGGIDWAGSGTAYTQNFDQAAANSGQQFDFTTTFFSYANPGSGIQRPDGTNFNTPNLQGGQASTGANAFELTTVATVNERGQCTNGGASCTFTVTGGTFNVYLDTNVNSRVGAGATLAQYQDGTRIIGGTITGGDSNFTASSNVPGAGSGRVSIAGRTDFTNSAFITPGLDGTTATATLQIGSFTTNWSRPTAIVGAADSCTASGPGAAPRSCTLTFQADANQSFAVAAVPIPGTLALLGAALAGVGITTRRRVIR